METGWESGRKIVTDVLFALSPGLLVIAEQLNTAGFGGVNWAAVVAASIGGVLAFFRMSPTDPRR